LAASIPCEHSIEGAGVFGQADRSFVFPKAWRVGLGFVVMQRTVVELIAAKRDGGVLEGAEIARLVRDYGAGIVADYQMAAFLMAVFFRGLDDAETVALTEAMLHSGTVIDLAHVQGTKVDKHSTGGVGDKVSICLAPMVAACGVPVPMVSGRGLGHTGGTLDKLEAIPGFRTDASVADFTRIVADVGTCMIGQTKDIAPADKRIYALRDVTATVESIPLIVASILSKKLAEGIDGLVLDVKVGRGAFMKTEASARALADKLVRVGTRAGKKVVAVLTRMDAPLGHAIGNANETREAIEVLQGRGPSDLVECTLVLGAEMLVLGGVARDLEEAREKLSTSISSGRAASVMERMIAAQGGDPSVVAHPERLEIASEVFSLTAPQSGFVASIDALTLGLTAVAMGAGRTRADQAVDPAVGLEVVKKPGERVQAGDVVARIFTRDRASGEAVRERVASAFAYADAPPPNLPLVVGRIT
jgi:pyrimidine-nucleoside phosphorylase